jgi:peptidase A4-like protein
MRKFHVAVVAVAAVSLALTAGAFASWPAGRAGAGADPGSSIQPGHPMVLARSNPSPAIRSARSTRRIDSTNWAGYAAARPGTAFRYVQATFFVPYVNCTSTPNAFSSHWVGLDGLNSRTVEQLGVEAGCAGSIPEYYAWYEMYPGNESSVFFVKPGNSIVASVRYNWRDKIFALTLDDTTTGQHFSRFLKCAASSCLRSSAQVISESPSDSAGRALPLADYRASGFSDITVADSLGHRGTLSSRWWNTYQIIEVGGSSGSVTGRPTSLFQGRAFGNYWFRES